MNKYIVGALACLLGCGGTAEPPDTAGGDSAPDAGRGGSHDAGGMVDGNTAGEAGQLDGGVEAEGGALGPVATCCQGQDEAAAPLACEPVMPFSCGGHPVILCTTGGCTLGEPCEGPSTVGVVVVCGQ